MAELAWLSCRSSNARPDEFPLPGGGQESYDSSDESSRFTADNNDYSRSAGECLSPMQLHSPSLLLAQEWLLQRHEVVISESDMVGTGGCACIVRGTYRRSQPVAVKLLPPDMLTDTAAKLLEREAYILSLVSRPRHPNIVRFVGAWSGGCGRRGPTRSPLLVTELLDVDLRVLRAQAHLTKSAMLSIFLDVSYGLCYLHEQKQPIIHRDINPSNILVKRLGPVGSSHWRAKIGDFGSADLMSQGSPSLGGGTELYSAPETLPSTQSQPPAEGISVQADIYSYGVMVLDVATDTPPERDIYGRLMERLHSQWTVMHSLVEKCTQPRPSDRPTASEIIDLLEQASDKESG